MNLIQYDIYIGIVKNKKLHILEDDQIQREDSKNRLLQYYVKEINSLDEIYIPPFYKTPSELNGMSESEENQTRIFCNTLIQESGIVLRLPQQTILTAMSIFNRIYWKKSFTIIEPFHVICACIFIATKTEETLRRIRDVISSCYYVLKKKEMGIKTFSNIIQKDFILDITKEEYSSIKLNVMAVETYILEELGFFLYILSDHPHKYLIHFIKHLRGTRELLQRSWNYLNDAYRTSLVVNYSPNVLACAAIFLAARMYYFLLPNSIKWWEAFDTKIEEIQEVAAEILNLYEIERIELNDVRNILKKYCKDYLEDQEMKKSLLEKNGEKKNRKIHKEYYRTSRDKSKSRSHNRSSSKKRHKKKRRNRSRSKDSEESSQYQNKRKYEKNYRKRKRKEYYDSDDSRRRYKKKRKHSKEKRDRSRSDSYYYKKSKKKKISYSDNSSSDS